MFFTKAVFTSWGFKFPLIVAFLQQAVTFPVAYAVDQPPITVNLVLDKAPLAAANMLNLVTGLMGTGDISMPMFVALRRFTMVFTLILEYALYRKTRDAATKLAVVLMISGAFFAALTGQCPHVRLYLLTHFHGPLPVRDGTLQPLSSRTFVVPILQCGIHFIPLHTSRLHPSSPLHPTRLPVLCRSLLQRAGLRRGRPQRPLLVSVHAPRQVPGCRAVQDRTHVL